MRGSAGRIAAGTHGWRSSGYAGCGSRRKLVLRDVKAAVARVRVALG